MPEIAPDPRIVLPNGLSHEGAAAEARRVATLELIDRRRPEPLRLPSALPATVGLEYRGGLERRARSVRVWRFGPPRGRAGFSYFVLGVRAERQAYYACYPADDEAWLAQAIDGDARAYAARERILRCYRRRLDERPRLAARHYELALIGTALGTVLFDASREDAALHPGPLEEFLPAARAAVERSPGNARRLATAAFLHERVLAFGAAAKLYGEAAAADPRSALYGALHADALLFAGDAPGAAAAAEAATRRARSARQHYAFGRDRPSLVEAFKETLFRAAQALRRRVEGVSIAAPDDAALVAAARRAVQIDPRELPPALRPLVPLARFWGLGDDAARGYVTDRATARDKAALRKALPPARRAEVQAWLDSLDAEALAGDEAGAFTHLLEALDEMGL